jgi:hypothetical protein
LSCFVAKKNNRFNLGNSLKAAIERCIPIVLLDWKKLIHRTGTKRTSQKAKKDEYPTNPMQMEHC